MPATRMVFRTTKRGPFKGDVDAVILGYPVAPGKLVCYAHVGQHSECWREWYRDETRPATRTERAALVRELRRIYGPIRILRRLPVGAWRGYP